MSRLYNYCFFFNGGVAWNKMSPTFGVGYYFSFNICMNQRKLWEYKGDSIGNLRYDPSHSIAVKRHHGQMVKATLI